jgi:hypothetical protein
MDLAPMTPEIRDDIELFDLRSWLVNTYENSRRTSAESPTLAQLRDMKVAFYAQADEAALAPVPPTDQQYVCLPLSRRELDVVREALAYEAGASRWDNDLDTIEAVIAKLEALGAKGIVMT